MNRAELGVKLRSLGLTKKDFAELMGLEVGSVYHWKEETPRYVLACLKMVDEIRKLQDQTMILTVTVEELSAKLEQLRKK